MILLSFNILANLERSYLLSIYFSIKKKPQNILQLQKVVYFCNPKTDGALVNRLRRLPFTEE